jgi:DNA-binding MarR family transcriptional regulator
MKLEAAIKQTKFNTPELKLSLNFIYTYNWFIDVQKQYFAQYGITQQQFNVLRILRGNYPKPYSTSQIRDRMLDKMSDASRIVDRLVKKDLVVRSTCADDKRLVDVVISEKGLRLLENIDLTIEDNVNAPFRNFSESEKETFYNLLDKIREN